MDTIATEDLEQEGQVGTAANPPTELALAVDPILLHQPLENLTCYATDENQPDSGKEPGAASSETEQGGSQRQVLIDRELFHDLLGGFRDLASNLRQTLPACLQTIDHLVAVLEKLSVSTQENRPPNSSTRDALPPIAVLLPGPETAQPVPMHQDNGSPVAETSSWKARPKSKPEARSVALTEETQAESEMGCAAGPALFNLTLQDVEVFARAETPSSPEAPAAVPGGDTQTEEPDQAPTGPSRAEPADLPLALEQFERAEAYRLNGDYQQAVILYSESLQLAPKYLPAYLNRGKVYRHLGEYDRAIEDFTQAIQLDPRSATAFHKRGNAYSDKGHFEEAVADYTRALRIDFEFAVVYMSRGLVYAKQGKLDRAIADANQALHIDPEFAGAYFIRGAAYSRRGSFDKAIIDFTKVIELDPEYPLAHNNRGLAYANKGDFDQAIADYNQAIRIDPHMVLVRYNRAMAYRLKGDWQRAISEFAVVLRAEPTNAMALFQRGQAFAEAGNFERAIAHYTEAIRLNPNHEEFYSKLREAYQAQAESIHVEEEVPAQPEAPPPTMLDPARLKKLANAVEEKPQELKLEEEPPQAETPSPTMLDPNRHQRLLNALESKGKVEREPSYDLEDVEVAEAARDDTEVDFTLNQPEVQKAGETKAPPPRRTKKSKARTRQQKDETESELTIESLALQEAAESEEAAPAKPSRKAGGLVVHCPKCGQDFTSADAKVGARTRCPHCQASFLTPGSAKPQPMPPDEKLPSLKGAIRTATKKAVDDRKKKKPESESHNLPWWVWVAACLVVGLAFWVGVTAFTPEKEPPVDPEKSMPVANMTCVNLCQEFTTNADFAEKTMKGKVVQVTGLVEAIQTEGDSAIVVLREQDQKTGAVACEMGPKGKESMSQIQQGRLVTLKGLCQGMEGDSKVKLVKCLFVVVPAKRFNQS